MLPESSFCILPLAPGGNISSCVTVSSASFTLLPLTIPQGNRAILEFTGLCTSTMTMTMTMTHSEKSHINQMRAWPYRQECRDHGPSKKNLSYWGSLLLGKRKVLMPSWATRGLVETNGTLLWAIRTGGRFAKCCPMGVEQDVWSSGGSEEIGFGSARVHLNWATRSAPRRSKRRCVLWKCSCVVTANEAGW